MGFARAFGGFLGPAAPPLAFIAVSTALHIGVSSDIWVCELYRLRVLALSTEGDLPGLRPQNAGLVFSHWCLVD